MERGVGRGAERGVEYGGSGVDRDKSVLGGVVWSVVGAVSTVIQSVLGGLG